MSDAIHEESYRGYLIEIHLDEHAENPRDWDNLWTMFCFHRRAIIGDKHKYNRDEYESWEDFYDRAIDADYDVGLVAPLYLYPSHDPVLMHGAIGDISTNYQIGYAFVEKQKLLSEFKRKRITKYVFKHATACLDAEIELYNQWHSGEVYGYVISDENGEMIDSCWGFYGMKYCLGEAKEIVDYWRNERGILTIS